MRTNLAAFTSSGCGYPSYLSVNLASENNNVEITVRSPTKSDGSCGDTSCMTMSVAEFKKLFSDMLVRVAGIEPA